MKIVVHPDPAARSLLVGAIASIGPSGPVLGAETLEQARSMWRASGLPLDALVLAMPGASAEQVQAALAQIEEWRPRPPVLLLVDRSLWPEPDRRPEWTRWLPEETAPAEVALALGRMAPSPLASLAALGLPEVLQVACDTGRTVRLSCIDPDGRMVGFVDVVDGELWNARDEQGEGPAAAARLVTGDVRTVALLGASKEGRRTLHGDCHTLLLEACKAADEAQRGAEGADLEVDEPRFERLMQQVGSALLRRDRTQAVELLREAVRLRPDDPRVQINLERLEQLGYSSMPEEPRAR